MRKTMTGVLAFMMGAVPLLAQESAARPCEGGPLAVVAQFLRLAPEQVQAVATALQERQATVEPILREIALREQRIRELIAQGADPAEIGTLVVEIHHLRQAAEAAQAQFLARFGSSLNDAQRARWEQVRVAFQLQPVVPAFQALNAL